MRLSLLSFVLLAGCPPATAPETDRSGDDDDTVIGDDDDDDTTACADTDADGDGVDACSDCDDGDERVFPGAPERCNERDDDCDGAPLPDESAACVECDAQGFWLPTRELSGSALVAEIRGLSEEHFCNDYGAATNYMFTRLDKVDGVVECVYTGRTTPVGSSKPDPNDMNTEHTWPQSQGADEFPAECDLHHLYPTDTDANSIRGNLPFGEVTGGADWSEGGSQLGRDASGTTVFEPRDVHKGNVARSMVYFSMQYGFPIDASRLQLYKSWSAQDPPDAAEVARTLDIAEQQGAANAYVLCPWLVDEL